MMSPTTKGPEYIQLADSNDNDPNGEDSFDDQIEIEMFPLKSASVYDRSNYMTMSPQSTNAELSPESSFGTRNIRTNREHARSISSNGGGGNHEVPSSTMPPPMTRVKSLLNRVRGGSFVIPPSPFNPIAQLKRLSSKFSTVSSASSGKRERSFVLGRVPQTPWNPDGIPYENIRIQLLFDIAGYLMMYGAPLYRVQHRLMKLSGLFEIPVSAFFLPTDLMISVGDNTVSPNRTFFLAIPSALNMYKLERIDKIARNVTSLMEGDRQNIESTASLSPSVIDRENRAFYEIEKQLADVVYDTDAFSAPWVRLLLAQFTSTFLLLICFKGDFAEAFITFFLSGLVHLLNNLINYLQLQQAAPIFVSFLVSFIASMVQTPVLWKWANAAGLCDTYVVIASLIAFMPGSQFALGMLEFSSLPLASLNRLFLAFMRSFQIGYGMTMGARFASMLLSSMQADIPNGICPTSKEMLVFDLWRLNFFIPMIICIMLLYKAHYTQWPYMMLSTCTCFTISILTKPLVSLELSNVISGLVLGIVANGSARWTKKPAIPAIYTGMFWLLPGGLGFSGAANLINGNGGTDFALQIMLKTLSMSIGLYIANMLVFPVNQHREVQDEALAI